MITITSASLRSLARRVKAFGCDTVELSAATGGLDARVASTVLDAKINAAVTEPGPLSPVVVMVADLCRVANVMHGEARITTSPRGDLVVSCLVATITLVCHPPIREARDKAIRAESVDAVVFGGAFARVAYSAAGDTNRYGLNGMMIEAVPGGGRMVATDGHRLAYAEAPGMPGECCLRDGYMLPSWLFPALASEVSESPAVAIGLHYDAPAIAHQKRGQGWIRIVTATAEITASLHMADFPAYRAVLPTTDPVSIAILDRDATIKAIRAARLFGSVSHTSTGKTRILAVTTSPGGVLFATATKDSGSAAATVPAGVTGSASIGVGAALLLDALRHLPAGPVEIACGRPLTPVLIRTLTDRASGLAVVMPCRLD